MTATIYSAIVGSATTFLLGVLVRQTFKARKALETHAREHEFLLRAMALVLKTLDLEHETERFWDSGRKNRNR